MDITEKKNCQWKASSQTSDSSQLPIARYRKQLIQAVKDNQFLIITGETGSGKTTQLPQYLHQAGLGAQGMIGITQPRRVATISVAHRVAEEMDSTVGREVGYQVRFDDCTSEDTVIKYMTDGCLLREILKDPELRRYKIIILDEAHERSLSTDILLGLLKKKFLDEFPSNKHTPRVIVMSATLETDKLSAFFNNCPAFIVAGRTYPVKQQFCNLIGPKDTDNSLYVKEVVKVTLDIHMNEAAGDILVFLTDQQRRIFQPPPPDTRKCVVATNIAATSLTISGIRYIVDCGFVKQLNHNPRIGIDVLEVVPISKSEAVQRAGRAGRTSAGKCYCVYSKEFWEVCMPDYTVPEIQRTSLTSVILMLKCLGVHDVIRFPYLDPPEERNILEALKQLYQCDAINRQGHVTRLGQFMVEFPLLPCLARVLIKAASYGCEDLLLPVAAMLSVENIFIRPGRPEKQKDAEVKHHELAFQAGGSNDFATLLHIFERCKSSDSPASWCHEHYIQWRAIKSAINVQTQLQKILSRLKQEKDFPVEHFNGCRSELLRQCLCSGYFTNVARRSIGKTFLTMDGHGSAVHIHPLSALFEQASQLDWILFHDVLVTSKIYIRTVCPILYEWVKDLLPKLHEIDAYELSSVARQEVTKDEIAKWKMKEDSKRSGDTASLEVLKKMEKRNDEKSVADARMRYLQRKQQKLHGEKFTAL
ncbi:probable ATP-dependent RNA helicase DHX40 isoform X2 [Protopterus annectens]|uniref:probable ATP-dependent RNA helicase DHX40 isoform X2 n=1 Tax=Protopterus annectens TaxID=7888 RepID=UPI001CFB5577|nr:probable ATP-dependent RNA helicase DHX40 isoform X2 [Protopterus annectens]